MVLFPNCKINIGLRVAGKRADGYHEIETIFYPLSLKDAAEITPATGKTVKPFDLEISGMDVPGEISDNLCYKAWSILQRDFPDLPPLKMHLLKGIPSGAGLGGGSSDGAHTLLLLNEFLRLGLSIDQLQQYALQLGSDCPFFIINKPCYATGRGENMEPLDILLPDAYVILVHGGVHISTAWAFSRIVPAPPVKSLRAIAAQPFATWKDDMRNDFEEPVFAQYPQLKMIKEELYAAGAVYASMTGTGSCVYGIFHNDVDAALPTLNNDYQVYNLKHQN